jgi:hypothetical protein
MKYIIITFLMSLAIIFAFSAVADAQCNDFLITNCSFETGDFTGWVTQDMAAPFFPLIVGGSGLSPGFGFFLSAPTDGAFAALHGFDGGGPDTIEIAQDVFIPISATQIMFDYRAAWDLVNFCAGCLDRTFTVEIEPAGGGAPLQSDLILTAAANTVNLDTGDLTGTVDVSAFANQTVRISFQWDVPENFTGPAFFQLDDVTLVLGTPTLSQWGMIIFAVFAGLGSLYYLRRKRLET